MIRAFPVRCFLLIAILAGSGNVTSAQTPSHLAAARELIAVKGAGNMFDPLVPGVIETAKNTFLRTNPNLAKELNEVAAALRNEFAPKRRDPMDEIARVFTQRFSEQELKDAITFYKTPLGRKLITEEAAAMEEGMKRVQTWADRFSEEILGRIRSEMKKRGHSI